jgi:hypothetical protein
MRGALRHPKRPLSARNERGKAEHCVFHEEPTVALARFFFAITRHFLMPGGFVGLLGGQKRVGHLGWGGHFGEIGPFLAHFRPKGSNRERERERILLLGFEAAGMAPWDPAGRGLVGGDKGGPPGRGVACAAP